MSSQKPSTIILMSLLVLAVGFTLATQSIVTCDIKGYTKYVAVKPGCKQQRLTISACYGMCQSFEVPRLDAPFKRSNHSLCQYDLSEWVSVELDDCQPGVNRTFVFLEARRCSCRACTSTNTYCGYA
ncbi:glycoprotein hormone beta-5-like [Glandiceps talaboti]